MKVIVVGAGVIGALTARCLVQTGAEVTVIDAGQPAGAASGASFGWINASFYLDEDHFRLRAAAMSEYRRLAPDLGTRAVRWMGCLCWEEQGDALAAQYRTLRDLGYKVRRVDEAAFRSLEPAIPAPKEALHFGDEGAVDLSVLVRDALTDAMSCGAKLITGVPVLGLTTTAGRVTGLRWSGGHMRADSIVVAAGAATPALLSEVDVPLPMPDRPGLILRSAPLPPLLAHILVAPGQELRQLPDGRLLAPTAASHQSDETEQIDEDPRDLADAAAGRVSELVGRSVTWESVTLANRPVPGDGRPVIGACGPDGLYVATMHSGATLAPLVARIAAGEVSGRTLSNEDTALIAPYRPERFKV